MKSDSITRKLYGQKSINRVKKKIANLGINCHYDPVYLLNIRFFSSIVIFVMIILLFDMGFIYAPVVTFLYYNFFFTFTLDRKIKQRIKNLDYEALYFFEVLTLSLEAGRNLEGSLRITCESIHSELSDEFSNILKEIDFGKSLAESLEQLRKRIPSDTISNIILNIIQSSIFGNSVLETMYNQLNYLNDKHILEVKADITKLPTKISIISVIFFLPLMLLLIFAPVLIDYFK